MDIAINQRRTSFIPHFLIAAGGVALIAGIIAGKRYLGEATTLVDANTLRLATVEQGPFTVTVQGVGELVPEKTLWLSAAVAGRVEEIYVQPGDVLTKNQPIAKLVNPQLMDAAANAEFLLAKARADHKAALIQLESNLLDADTKVEQARLTYEGHRVELDAQQALRQQANSSISDISFQRTTFNVKSSHLDWVSQQKKLAKIKTSVEVQQQAQQAVEHNLHRQWQLVLDRLEQRIIRAPIDGVLQNLELELGQEMSLSQSVGQIADPKRLQAQLRVQELQIKGVQLGQVVSIDTRKTRIQGQVVRIDPRVIQGMVQVDVALSGELPPEARPALSVEGIITITDKSAITYVKKPAYIEENQYSNVYRLTETGQLAQRVAVQFGQSSVNHIEVSQGLSPGDQIIISNIDHFSDNSEILLYD